MSLHFHSHSKVWYIFSLSWASKKLGNENWSINYVWIWDTIGKPTGFLLGKRDSSSYQASTELFLHAGRCLSYRLDYFLFFRINFTKCEKIKDFFYSEKDNSFGAGENPCFLNYTKSLLKIDHRSQTHRKVSWLWSRLRILSSGTKKYNAF